MAVVIPEVDWNWSAGGSGRYVYIDLEISVPDDIELNVKDSSGDLAAYGTGAIMAVPAGDERLLVAEVRDTRPTVVELADGETREN